MSTVTITIRDTESEAVDIKAEFDPPLNSKGADGATPAQSIALEMLEAVASSEDITRVEHAD